MDIVSTLPNHSLVDDNLLTQKMGKYKFPALEQSSSQFPGCYALVFSRVRFTIYNPVKRHIVGIVLNSMDFEGFGAHAHILSTIAR